MTTRVPIRPTYRPPRTNTRSKKKRSRSELYCENISLIIFNGILIILSFSFGFLVSTRISGRSTSCVDGGGQDAGDAAVNPFIGMDENDIIDAMVKERLDAAMQSVEKSQHLGQFSKHRFPETTSSYANGMVQIPKEDFLSTFDYGFPEPQSEQSASEALLIYNTPSSLPSSNQLYQTSAQNSTGKLLTLSSQDATENCEVLNVVSTKILRRTSPDRKSCIAIVGDSDNHHVQKWMRMPNGNNPRSSNPLVPVARSAKYNGNNEFFLPNEKHMDKHSDMLRNYLNTVDDVLERLKPVVQQVSKNNTVIVMTCNFGQSDVLMNFVCAAKTRGLDIGNVLVFATDEQTYEVVTRLGVTAFYDEKTFGDLPVEEGHKYGDQTFSAMMFAKVVTVQLVNKLGYDVLFQDVDIIWFKHPLSLFHSESSELKDYDMIFQDDGNRQSRFAPYSANSGFYYVRANERTSYLLTSLLYNGAMITANGSHQSVLITLMIEHSSLFNLRIKVLHGEDFPCGVHYHMHRPFMKEIVTKQKEPYLFHMSWTLNKINKILYFKQMGWWYVNELCEGDGATETLNGRDDVARGVSEYMGACCAAEPLISCHYRDKPSVRPCPDSPNIDKKGRSFW